MADLSAADIAAIREYWTSPTGMATAPAGMVEAARYNINALADEVERLRADRSQCEEAMAVVEAQLAEVVGMADELALKADVARAAADVEPLIVIRSFSRGHSMIAGALHAVLHGGPPPHKLRLTPDMETCVDCKGHATAVLRSMIEVTDEAFASERFPDRRVLPYGWAQERPAHPDVKTEKWVNVTKGRTVLYSESKQDDGRWWVHVSASRRDTKVPTWEQLVEAKDLFIGDAEAYVVFPPRARYVNQTPGVLHVFACRDEPDGVLPDFTRGTGSL